MAGSQRGGGGGGIGGRKEVLGRSRYYAFRLASSKAAVWENTLDIRDNIPFARSLIKNNNDIIYPMKFPGARPPLIRRFAPLT